MVLEIFKNWPITNMNCLWQPYLLYDWHEIWIFCTGSPIHHLYKVTIHCAPGFRGVDLKKLINQKQELPMAAMFVNGSGQNEQS